MIATQPTIFAFLRWCSLQGFFGKFLELDDCSLGSVYETGGGLEISLQDNTLILFQLDPGVEAVFLLYRVVSLLFAPDTKGLTRADKPPSGMRYVFLSRVLSSL